MRPTHDSRRGAILIYVLTLLALAAALMAVMAQGSRALQRETDRAVSEAQRSNLHASATAWARQHADESLPPTTLDTEALGIAESSVTVSVGPGGSAMISASYRCPLFRRSLHVKVDGSMSVEPAEPDAPIAADTE